MSVNRLRRARLRTLWALWRSNNHPQALATAAMVWLASGRYAKALRFAERAHHRLSQGAGEIDCAAICRLTSEVYIAGALASCHLRNDAKTPVQRDLFGCEAHHWFRLLAKHDAEALHLLLDEPVLRDLRPIVTSYLASNPTLHAVRQAP